MLAGKFNQLSWKRKLATVKGKKADVSSISPSSERLGHDSGAEGRREGGLGQL